ncbi:hypothetical protein ACJRO7_033796 [Eucalyptus globulus]|uniref:Malectin-like domain-containing protein n=1 Tax=Eucalyptus globulus TaxID=34317 RepID=A0ABD3J983_EUCGL
MSINTLNLLYAVSTLFMSVTPISAVFISINCGATGTLTENSIQWVGDDAYIKTGQPQEAYAPPSEVLGTLRAFPAGKKKNCYTIDVDGGSKILVRPSFYYGDYDSLSSPPTFDLLLDGNHWATVNTSTTEAVYGLSYEAIYTVKSNATSVCIAQTLPNQLPFINSLEIRSLLSSMYSHVDSDRALLLATRVAATANDTPIRYPNDVYDRIWNPALGSLSLHFELNVTSNDAGSVDVKVEDSPPEAVFQNAVTTTTPTGGPLQAYIMLYSSSLSLTEAPVYVITYFSEVARLGSNQKRSFQMYVNSNPVSNPIVPPYGSVAEFYLANTTASSNTNFTLKPTADSTLFPLINAFELYTISNPLAAGTNTKDVEGLSTLQSRFRALQQWTGDPCQPSAYAWDWVSCSTDASPRVTALSLSGFGLSGTLPDFSVMDALQTIDVHSNSLNGPIPDFLGILPDLQLLNLADNRFSGTVPSSISKNSKLKLTVTGNCLNGVACKAAAPTPPASSDGSPSSSVGNKIPLKLAVLVQVIFFLFTRLGDA